MNISLIQMRMENSMEENCEQSLALMDKAAKLGAKVVCFPELQLSPFFPQYPGRDFSEFAIPINHPFVTKLSDKCRELGIVGCINFYLVEGENRFDASPVIDSDGAMLGVSKMVHIVQMPCFFEQDYYAPSDSGFKVFDTAEGKIGVVVCYDRHFPESIRSCAVQEAELVIIPTANIKGERLDIFEWEARIAAVQNGIFIAMCNRVGIEDSMHFCGESIVVDPNGDVVAKADDTPQILQAKLDLSMIAEAREARPFLALRRPDAYIT